MYVLCEVCMSVCVMGMFIWCCLSQSHYVMHVVVCVCVCVCVCLHECTCKELDMYIKCL